MMATRQQIRTKIKTIASLAGFTAGFDYAPSQLFDDELPALSVYFTAGDSEYTFDHEAETTAQVIVEITLKEPGNLDGALDEKANAVQQLLRDNPFLDGLVGGMYRTNFNYDRDEESSVGTLQLTYTVNYTDED